MELFESFLFESGSYIGVRPDHSSIRLIRSIIRMNQLTNCYDEDELHATLIYSRGSTVPESFPNERKLVVPYVAEIRQFELLGPNNDYLTISLKSSDLVARHNHLREKYGLNHSWDKYVPHITLKEKFEGGVEALKLPDDRIITFNVEYCEPIDEDWNDG